MFERRRAASSGPNRNTMLIVGLIVAVVLFYGLFFSGDPMRHKDSHTTDTGGHTKPKSKVEADPEETEGDEKAEQAIDWSGGKFIQLYNGVEMPLLGLGTAALSKPHPIISFAVQHGYTLLDSASDTGPWYHTESIIGQIFADYELGRPDYFITTKLHPQDFGYETALASLKKSLENLKTNYVDLYLLHYPACSESLCKESPAGTWKEAWKALEKIYHDKQARAIGISNFSLEQIKQLLKFTKVKPHVVQNWFDPLHQDWDTVNFCRSHNIVYQAYSPLGTQHQKTPNPVLTHPTIVAIAEKHGRTPAQVVLRWMVQEGIPTIPRTNSNTHLKENSEIIHFALPKSDMEKIRNIKP